MTTTKNIHLAKICDRKIIAITGDDRFHFLQGLITADIEELKEKHHVWSAILTPQGRLIADFFLINYSQDVTYLECAHVFEKKILQFFSKFLLRSQVSFMPQDFSVYVQWGEDLPHIDESLCTFFDPRIKTAGKHIILAEKPTSHLNASQNNYDKHRLSLGLPSIDIDATSGETLPAECNMDLLGGISFTKGCYIGQEVTARLYYRDRLKKRLIPVQSTTQLPPIGTAIECGSKPVGELRSHNGKKGLAMLKLANLDEVHQFPDGTSLQLIIPSWLKNGLNQDKGEK